MNKKQYYVYEHPSVYVVLEHAVGINDAVVHGVYTNRAHAYGKVDKVKAKRAKEGREAGYLAILKKPIEGRSPQTVQRKATDIYPFRIYIYENE